jgi:hypothetical protein
VSDIVTTPWVAYTPVFTGFGTCTAVEFYSRRVGDTLEVKGRYTEGTPTAVEARIELGFNGTSGNVTAAGASKIGSQPELAGSWCHGAAGTFFGTILSERSVAYVTMGAQSSGQGGNTKQNASAFGTSLTFNVNFKVPIAGW